MLRIYTLSNWSSANTNKSLMKSKLSLSNTRTEAVQIQNNRAVWQQLQITQARQKEKELFLADRHTLI